MYIAVVWSDEGLLSKDARQLWQVVATCCGLCLLFLLISWFFSALRYGTTLTQLLTADIPGWASRKTVYSCYSFATFAALATIHAISLHALGAIGDRRGS
jgi:hypothetical protein